MPESKNRIPLRLKRIDKKAVYWCSWCGAAFEGKVRAKGYDESTEVFCRPSCETASADRKTWFAGLA